MSVEKINNKIAETFESMDLSIMSLKDELSKLRTGKASAALVEGIRVEYYGSMMPLNQVANVTTPDPRTIQIVPWEAAMVSAIEKAILAANIGFTPQNDGKVVRISVPALTEERRKEIVKLLKKMGEESKISVRNYRRDANEVIKKEQKDGFPEDLAKKETDRVQKRTDEKVKEIDDIVIKKEKEIMTI